MTLQEFPGPVTQHEWETELGHQVRTLGPVEEAHERVAAALAAAYGCQTLQEKLQPPPSGG